MTLTEQYPQLVEIQEYCMEQTEKDCLDCKFNMGSEGEIYCRFGINGAPCFWILDEEEGDGNE